MSRTNSQAEIFSEEQLAPRANRLVIKKKNHRVDSHIIDTMLRFVVEILRHHKLYKPTFGYDEDPETKMIVVSKMIATRLHQPGRAIMSVLNRSLTGKDSSWDTVRLPILQILWDIIHSANLDFASLIWDEFEWQAVERSSRPSKMSKLLYTRFTKLIINHFLLTTRVFIADQVPSYTIPDTMISDAIKKLGYKFYMAKKVESENAKTVDKPEEQHASPIKSGRGKGFMIYGDQVANVPNKLKKDVVLRKTRSLTIAKEAVVAVIDMYNEWGHKLKGPAVKDPAIQPLLDLREGSKASRLESLKQKKQAVAGEGSNVAHNKYYDSSDTDSDTALNSSSSNKTKESVNEINDANESNIDLSNDNPHGDDDVVGFGVFMHNKSTATTNSTYLSLTVTSSSLNFIQTLLDETPPNKLTDESSSVY
ncbi:hypothetical protein Tco_0588151 [Tanacetum coccineum]